jgi:hypothetical protein
MAKKIPWIRFGGQPPTGFSRLIVLIAGVALTLPLVVIMQATHRPAHAASDLLSDLGMAHPQNLRIKNCTVTDFRDCTYVGQKQLRFDTLIVNVGAGRFEARGKHSTSSDPMTVTQRIYNDAGGYRDLPTTAQMYFAGDGHNHWHLRDLESYELIRLDNGSKVGAGAKEGICFFDNFLFVPRKTPSTKAAGETRTRGR